MKQIQAADKDSPRRVRKSEQLTDQEFLGFENWVKNQRTKVDACEALGIGRPTLDALLFKRGQGSPATIAKIRTIALNNTTP
jgi:hypothetical protein